MRTSLVLSAMYSLKWSLGRRSSASVSPLILPSSCSEFELLFSISLCGLITSNREGHLFGNELQNIHQVNMQYCPFFLLESLSTSTGWRQPPEFDRLSLSEASSLVSQPFGATEKRLNNNGLFSYRIYLVNPNTCLSCGICPQSLPPRESSGFQHFGTCCWAAEFSGTACNVEFDPISSCYL